MYNIFKFNYNNKETYNINKLSETALIKFPCFLGEFLILGFYLMCYVYLRLLHRLSLEDLLR